MVKKTETKKEEISEKKDIFKIWAEGYSGVSKMWEDYYVNLYKPWIDSTGVLFDRAAELSKNATVEKYKEFYDEWLKTYQNTFGKFYPIPARQYDRESIEKFLACADESANLFKSWISELEENSSKTREMLSEEPTPEKLSKSYDIWMKSYDKIFDEVLALPVTGSSKEIFENWSGIPNIYFRNFMQMSKLWKNTYVNLQSPFVESMIKLSGKMAELSKGEAGPEAYKEFYNLWMNTYQETFGRMFRVQSMQPSKEMLDNFMQSTNVYLDMYKSWIAAMEKIADKSKDLSKRTSDPEAYKEFYNLWVKTYEKAFDDFFERMPAVGPMKPMMEPVKSATRIYSDSLASMFNIWMKTGFGSTSGSTSRI